METRLFGLIDRLIGEFDKAIKVLSVPAQPSREAPAGLPTAKLGEAEQRQSSRLMRVNHSGEVAAQALYRGQALTARSAAIGSAMRHAAAEEGDHLAWCEQRLRELKGRTSVLNPLWYLGSFAIGAIAGRLDHGASLGFVAETERQVESHLLDHLQRLSAADGRSRAILEQMKHDEVRHGAEARVLGGKELPFLLRLAMRGTARLMTFGAYWL